MAFESVKKIISDFKKWTWHHLATFLMTFFIYASFHVSRKAFSNIKNRMGKTLTPETRDIYPFDLWRKEDMFSKRDSCNVFLGNIDLSFFLAYAGGLFVSGYICDRVNLRYILTFGLWGSAVCTCLFGYISAVAEIRNEYYYLGIFFLNGLIQACGRPASVAIMGNWFTKSSSGLVFGVWSCNGSMGNVIGSLIVAAAIEYGYEYGMLMVSVFSLCAGVLAITCLIPHPNDIGITNPDQATKADIPLPTINGAAPQKDTPAMVNCTNGTPARGITTMSRGISKASLTSMKVEQKPIKFWEACLIPGVIPYSLANACLKMVNYAFLFWLPTYLAQGLKVDDKTSDNLSNLYDVGGMIGGIFAGVVSDSIGYRSPVLTVMLIFSLISMYLFQSVVNGMTTMVILMILIGFFLGGPANTISSTISADLGKHHKLKGNSAALGTVTGIVEGTGSLGAAIGQRYVAVIQRSFGWKWVFYVLIMASAMSIALVIPILVKEIRRMVRRRNLNQT